MVLWTMSSALNIVHGKTNGRSAKTWPSKISLVGTAKNNNIVSVTKAKLNFQKKDKRFTIDKKRKTN